MRWRKRSSAIWREWPRHDDGDWFEDDYEIKVDLRLWRKLLAYTLHYRGTAIAFAFVAMGFAGSDLCFPILTGRVIADVQEHGRDVQPGAVCLDVCRADDRAVFVHLGIHCVCGEDPDAREPRHSPRRLRAAAAVVVQFLRHEVGRLADGAAHERLPAACRIFWRGA